MLEQLDLKFVVASTPRSGTVFVSNVLNKLGVNTGHESIFMMNGIEGALKNNPHIRRKLEVDVSGFVNPYLNTLDRLKIPVYHLIRDPVKSINSMANFFTRGHLQIGVLQQPRWLAVAELWHYWHKELHRHCQAHTLKLETIQEDMKSLAIDLEYDWTPEQIADTMDVGRGTSVAIKPQEVTWDILPDHIQEFARLFGYTG